MPGIATDFSLIGLFQRTPNPLLGRYFHHKHGVLQEIAFEELHETGSRAGTIFDGMLGHAGTATG